MSWRSRSTCPDPRWAAALLVGLAASVEGVAHAGDPQPPAPAPLEVSVQAGPRQREPGRVTLSGEEGRRVPGTAGDPLLAAGSLPGMARPTFDSGKLVVWGSAPADTRVYVDGVPVPALYHGGGLRGVIGADLVESVDLVPGAYEAAYGRGLGGMIRVRTPELPAEGVHGFAAADFLDASAMATAAIAGGKLRVAVAGRASYLDRLLSGVVSPAVADLLPIPRYEDAQAKISLRLREDEALHLLLLASGDTFALTAPSPDPGAARRQSTTQSFQRASLRYTRALPDGTVVEVVPFFGRDAQGFDASYGAIPARTSESAFRYGARASARIPFSRALALTAGVDVDGTTAALSREGSLTLPAREGDLSVFGQLPGGTVNSDRWNVDLVGCAPYASVRIDLGPVVLVPGLRVESFLIEGSRATPRVGATPAIGFSRLSADVDPRLEASYSPSPSVTFSASAGIYHQPPDPADLSAVFGTPALGPQRAINVSAGEDARLGAGIELSLVGYYRLLDHLVVRSRLPDPTLAQTLVQDGEGRSYGAQILLRRAPSRTGIVPGLYGWIAYTLSRSERRYAGDASYRLFDYDQPHVFAAVAGYEIGGFRLGARFRAATGLPRTPVVGSYVDANSGQYEPIFGAQNTIRLPTFYQLDLRAERSFTWSRAKLVLSLDVLNVTFHENAEEIVYTHDYARHGYLTGLPLLGVLGARIEI